MQQAIDGSGLIETASLIREHFGKGKTVSANQLITAMDEEQSEITIYQQAIANHIDKESIEVQPMEVDGPIDTSGEINTSSETERSINQELNSKRLSIEKLIVDQRRSVEMAAARKNIQQQVPQPQPSTSKAVNPEEEASIKANDLVKEAESAKIRMLQPPGMSPESNLLNYNPNRLDTVLADEDYMYLTAHIDENTQNKVQKGEFIDLAKLLPRDRIITEEDNRMQLIIKEGASYWVPMTDSLQITGFNHWSQAFRVYTDIFARANPMRASELIQYSHVIHTISQQFTWDNVYMYDKDFRLHMSRHPRRNWSLILQQAWAMRLREPLRSHSFNHRDGSNNYNSTNRHSQHNQKRVNVNDICRRFNRGKCSFGMRCKYEHRCNYCFKMGHCVLNCRKAQADKEGRGTSNNSPAKPKAEPAAALFANK